jgi:hypothetical protein
MFGLRSVMGQVGFLVQAVTCLLAAVQAASGDKFGWKVLRLVRRLLWSQIITHHWFNASVVLTFSTISSLSTPQRRDNRSDAVLRARHCHGTQGDPPNHCGPALVHAA